MPLIPAIRILEEDDETRRKAMNALVKRYATMLRNSTLLESGCVLSHGTLGGSRWKAGISKVLRSKADEDVPKKRSQVSNGVKIVL